MTIRQHLKQKLVDHMLWDDEAAQIVSALEADERSAPMRGRWDEDTTHYPSPLLDMLWTVAIGAAERWLVKNAPNHVARRVLNEL